MDDRRPRKRCWLQEAMAFFEKELSPSQQKLVALLLGRESSQGSCGPVGKSESRGLLRRVLKH